MSLVATGGKPHVGDIGTEFQLEVAETNAAGNLVIVDLTSSTAVQVIFTNSEGLEKGPFTATILNPPGTDGIITFTNTDPTLLDAAGLFFCRARITFSVTDIFDSNDVDIEVLGEIN